MRIGAIIVVVWLVIGVIAAVQRDYFSNAKTNCAEVSDTAVTIVAGPLNYVGVNPKVKCKGAEPSKWDATHAGELLNGAGLGGINGVALHLSTESSGDAVVLNP
jgi:hypothetical protein